jgi:AcrR family transcriptional regulator
VRDRRAPPEARRYIVGKTLQVFDEANDREAPEVVDQGRVSVGAIAEETGLSRQTVYRIKDAPAAAEAGLAAWGL